MNQDPPKVRAAIAFLPFKCVQKPDEKRDPMAPKPLKVSKVSEDDAIQRSWELKVFILLSALCGRFFFFVDEHAQTYK